MQLDPRLKKLGFRDAASADQAIQHITGELRLPENKPQQSEKTLELGQACTQASLWQLFDLRVSEVNSKRTPTSDVLVEIRQYTQTKHIERKEDPLVWWRDNTIV